MPHVYNTFSYCVYFLTIELLISLVLLHTRERMGTIWWHFYTNKIDFEFERSHEVPKEQPGDLLYRTYISVSLTTARSDTLQRSKCVDCLKCCIFFPVQDVLYTACNPIGSVLRIVIFKRNGIQAMVEYPCCCMCEREWLYVCVYLCVEMYHMLSLTQLLQVWVSSVCSEGQSCSERSWHLCWLLYTQDWICKGKRQKAAAVTSRSSCKVQALCAALQSH